MPLAAGKAEEGRLVTSKKIFFLFWLERCVPVCNFLVKASVVKMAEKQNSESFVIDLNDCSPPSTSSAKVAERPFPLLILQLRSFLQERRPLTRLTLHLLTFPTSPRGAKIDV